MILLAQTDIAEKALDTASQAIQAGVLGLAVMLTFVLIIVVIFGGRIVTKMLDFISRVTAAIERMDKAIDKVSDQSEAQSTVLGELSTNIHESKTSMDTMTRGVKINTKVTSDSFKASAQSLSILNRGLERTETYFKGRADAIERQMQLNHQETLSAIANIKSTPQPETSEAGDK